MVSEGDILMFDRIYNVIFERATALIIFLCGAMALFNGAIPFISAIWNPEIPSVVDDVLHGLSAVLLWLVWGQLKRVNK